MSEYFIIQGLALGQLLIVVPLGVFTWWALLRVMDRALGVNFRAQIRNAKYPEIYYSVRAFSAAYLVAELYSRIPF